ncbi:ABC transporter ATP-binding protein [Nitrogeniibacter aestuarii]|uniref:ABC transporter ATP-binding protein n=1 Tax=Nitrogeniibacter aestuarii TaxID=2815343 RepID=UPI001D12DFAD|nr:ABC transporter ATP-binding protein [Nitrogeniibacter aestuarii]
MSMSDGMMVWRSAFRLGGSRSRRWGSVSTATGLLAFVFDFCFALTLQRFFVSIGLVSGSADMPLLGAPGSPASEALLFVAAGLLKSLTVWANSVSTGATQVAFEARVRSLIAQWSLADGKVASGRVATLFGDITLCSAAAVSTSYYFVGRLLMLGATLVTLLVYSLETTAAVLLLLVFLTPAHRMLDGVITRASVDIQQSLASVNDRLMRGVKNAIFLNIHGRLGREVEDQHALISRFENSSLRYYSFASARGVIPQVVGICAVVLIALQGSQVFADNSATLIAYLYMVMRFFQTLAEVARVTANIRGNWPRLQVLSDWYRMDFAPVDDAIRSELHHSRQAVSGFDRVGLTLKDVDYAWPGACRGLEKIDLEFAPGSATVIVGPSGVGKTTLLLLISSLIRPDQGSITVSTREGVFEAFDVKHRLLATAAYVGPDPFVIDGTVREFLAFGQSESKTDEEMWAALHRAHCEFLEGTDAGLEYRLSEQGGGLSAGQKQRLSIARALLREPRLLILDEATANLDPGSELAIIDTVRALKGGVTIVAVTHREAVRAIADSIITFDGQGSAAQTACDAK